LFAHVLFSSAPYTQKQEKEAVLYVLEVEFWLQVRIIIVSTPSYLFPLFILLSSLPPSHPPSLPPSLPPLKPQKDKHARLSLGPRTFLELGDFVRAHEMEMPQILYF